MPNKTDWLHDLLKDWAKWNSLDKNEIDLEREMDSPWPPETVLYKSVMGRSDLPPGSSPPPGVERPRDVRHVHAAMQRCLNDDDLKQCISTVQAYYAAMHEHGEGEGLAAESVIKKLGISRSMLWHLKKQGEIAIKASMAR